MIIFFIFDEVEKIEIVYLFIFIFIPFISRHTTYIHTFCSYTRIMYPQSFNGMIFPLEQPKQSFNRMINYNLEQDDDTIVWGEVYSRSDTDRCAFTIGECSGIAKADSSKSLWMIVKYNDDLIYFQYSLSEPHQLKSIYVPTSCWSGDHMRYDFDINGNVVYFVDFYYSGNRRDQAFVKNGIFMKADTPGGKRLIGENCSTLEELIDCYDIRNAVLGN